MALSAADLKVGDTHSEVLVEDLKRTQLVQYAGASGDYNPVHTDEKFVTEIAGYPTVFAHGMLTMGMTGMLVTNWVGDGRLTKYGVRFVNQVWPGDNLTGTAEVTDIREEDGQHLVDLSITTVNQDDVPVPDRHGHRPYRSLIGGRDDADAAGAATSGGGRTTTLRPPAASSTTRAGALLPGVLSPDRVADLAAEIRRAYEQIPADRRRPRTRSDRAGAIPLRDAESLGRLPAGGGGSGPFSMWSSRYWARDCHVIANTAWWNPPAVEHTHGGGRWHIDAGPHVPLPDGVRWDRRVPHPVFAVAAHILLQDCPAGLRSDRSAPRQPPLGSTAAPVTGSTIHT